MKEELPNEKLCEADDKEIDIKELLFKYLIHWPWFVGTVVACLIAAYVYLYVATPVYNISATVLIKDDKKGGSSNNVGGLDELGLNGLITSSQSIDNEIEVLRSKTLVKEVVSYLNLYVTYQDEDLIPSKELYKTSPVQVNMTPQEAEKLKKNIVVEMVVQPQGSLDVNVKMDDREIQKHFEKLPAILPTDRGTISFFQATDSIPVEGDEDAASSVQGARHITATISRPMNVARGYCEDLAIEPTSKTTSVVTVSLKNSSLRRGQDFINQLLEMYNRNTNNDKNEIAQKTAEFIDERIGIISKELGSTEADLETFKRDAGITDLSSDAQIALSGNAEYEKKQVENRTQISLVEDLKRYLSHSEYEVLPSNVGLKDAALATQIDRYNEMLIERKRLLRTSTESNPAIVNLDTSIRATKANVQATIEGTLQGLFITKADLDREAKRYMRRISDAPGQERPELFCCLHGMAGAGSCPRVPAPGVPAASDFHRVSVCFCLPPFAGRAEGAFDGGPGTPTPSHGLAILAGLLLPRRKARMIRSRNIASRGRRVAALLYRGQSAASSGVTEMVNRFDLCSCTQLLSI